MLCYVMLCHFMSCYVQVFGKTAVDVLLSQGVLAVSHSSKHVKLYSFEYIVNKVMETLFFFVNVWFIDPVCFIIIPYVFFSLQFRIEELVLGQQCELNGGKGIVGEAPYGIPVNIHIHGG